MKRWLHHYGTTRTPRATLLCCPQAGGNAGMFRSWAQALPRGIALAGVQLPGRGERLAERPREDMPALVDALVEAIRTEAEPPFILFGHSLGALIAFELARAFTAEAMPPLHLIVSGRRAPMLPRKDEDIRGLGDDAFVEAMRTRYDAIPEELVAHPEVLTLLLPALRADMTLVETYRYRRAAPLPLPITAFAGEEDWLAPAADMAGWAQDSAAGFALRSFAGGHFYFERDPAPLLAAVAEIVARAAAGGRG